MNFSDPAIARVFPYAAAVIGLCLGSFYNVCIHRYLTGESIVLPASHCPKCGRRLSWWENLPLVSYLALKGRCRGCGEAISPRYPLVEGLSGVWAVLLALEYGPSAAWLVYMFFGGLFIVMSFIDLEIFILPDVMTLPGAGLAFLSAVFILDVPVLESVIGALAGAGIFLFIQVVFRVLRGIEGLGTGDIKLMLLIGALLGWKSLPLVVLIGSSLGLVGSVVLMKRANVDARGMQTAIPFGPFLCLGGMVYILYGPSIWTWYLGVMSGT